jgi:hypothetical protein
MPAQRGSRLRAALPVLWFLLSVLCVGIDYLLGPFIQFPIVYLIPVSLAAWHSGRMYGLVLAAVLPLVRLYFISLWDPPWTFTESAVNAVIRIAVLGAFAWLVSRTAGQTRRLSTEVSVLSGMLPVCARCRKIRSADGGWEPLEAYVAKNPADFNQELCPDCGRIAEDVFNRR